MMYSCSFPARFHPPEQGTCTARSRAEAPSPTMIHTRRISRLKVATQPPLALSQVRAAAAGRKLQVLQVAEEREGDSKNLLPRYVKVFSLFLFAPLAIFARHGFQFVAFMHLCSAAVCFLTFWFCITRRCLLFLSHILYTMHRRGLLNRWASVKDEEIDGCGWFVHTLFIM